MNKFFKLFSVVILGLFISCNNGNKDAEEEYVIPDDWGMIETFTDEISEFESGEYYPLFYHNDNPMKDTFGEANNNVVALGVENSLDIGKSTAIAWVADSRQKMTLKTNETEGNSKYQRVYENDLFTVDLNMRLVERIDGMDEEDMLIYAGKMKISRNDNGESKEYRVKGGI